MKRRTLLAAALLLVVPTAAGCATAVATPAAGTVVVGGARAGSASGWTPEMDRLLDDGITAGETWTFVSADGNPEITGTLPLASAAQNDLGASAERAAQRDRAQQLLDRPADGSEADPLGGLVLAGRVLADLPAPRRVVVADSLLQTVAPLPFPAAEGALLAADPVEVADAMERDGTLPRLPGVEVVLVGAGDVAPPQPRLPGTARSALLALWTVVLERAGATVRVVEAPRTGAPPPNLPPVTPVQVPEPPTAVPTAPITVSLPDQVLGFLPDRAEFRDPVAAAAVVRPFAEALASGRFRLDITGTTSSAGTVQGRLDLSRDRAGLVAILVLRASGAAPDLVTITAAGTDFPAFRPDRDNAGQLDPVAAAANRQVILRLLPR